MKKQILPLCLAFFFLSFTVGNQVYVCISDGAVAYHKYQNCKGLLKCRHEIKTMPKEEAKKMGRKPCCYCYSFCK